MALAGQLTVMTHWFSITVQKYYHKARNLKLAVLLTLERLKQKDHQELDAGLVCINLEIMAYP